MVSNCNRSGEIWYEFSCLVDLYVAYSINSPELVNSLSTENMKLLSCEVALIGISDAGVDII